MHPLWLRKGAFLRLPQSISASGYKHYKCYIAMLQCNSGQGYWECRRVEGTHKGQRGKRRKTLSLHTCFKFHPGFSSQHCCQFIRVNLNLNGANRCPGLFLAYCSPCDTGVLFPTVPSHSVHDPQLTPESIFQVPFFCPFFAPKYLPSLYTSSQPYSIC